MTINTLTDSAYFTNFPIINYNGQAADNLTLRFRLREDVINQTILFMNYEVQEGERPDTIAYKIYGDSHLDWLVMFANNMIDPYFQWPMTNLQFMEYIESAYGSVSEAAQTIQSYQWIQYPASIDIDGTVHPEIAVNVDATFYATLNANVRRTVSFYDYENTNNFNRKFIQLVDPIYAAQILSEFKQIFD